MTYFRRHNVWATATMVLGMVLVCLILWLTFAHDLLRHSSSDTSSYPMISEVEDDVAESARVNGHVRRVNCAPAKVATWACIVYFANGHHLLARAQWNAAKKVLGVSFSGSR